MESIILRASFFLLMIVIAYALKRAGVLKKEDGISLARIVMNVTLPCAILVGFRTFVFEWSYMVIPVISLLAEVLMLAVGYAITRGRSRDERIFYMMCLPAYNIGNFTLPFISGMLGSAGIIAACLFDMGNSPMCLGLNFAMTLGAMAGEIALILVVDWQIWGIPGIMETHSLRKEIQHRLPETHVKHDPEQETQTFADKHEKSGLYRICTVEAQAYGKHVAHKRKPRQKSKQSPVLVDFGFLPPELLLGDLEPFFNPLPFSDAPYIIGSHSAEPVSGCSHAKGNERVGPCHKDSDKKDIGAERYYRRCKERTYEKPEETELLKNFHFYRLPLKNEVISTEHSFSITPPQTSVFG